MEDKLILVDVEDKQIGTMGKAEAHRLGKLHRAFSIFIVDGDKMLIQKRNSDKYHSGDYGRMPVVPIREMGRHWEKRRIAGFLKK